VFALADAADVEVDALAEIVDRRAGCNELQLIDRRDALVWRDRHRSGTVAEIGVFCADVLRRSAVTTTLSTGCSLASALVSPGFAAGRCVVAVLGSLAAGGADPSAMAVPLHPSASTDAVTHNAQFFIIPPAAMRTSALASKRASTHDAVNINSLDSEYLCGTVLLKGRAM